MFVCEMVSQKSELIPVLFIMCKFIGCLWDREVSEVLWFLSILIKTVSKNKVLTESRGALYSTWWWESKSSLKTKLYGMKFSGGIFSGRGQRQPITLKWARQMHIFFLKIWKLGVDLWPVPVADSINAEYFMRLFLFSRVFSSVHK